jgi:hypothetical protein
LGEEPLLLRDPSRKNSAPKEKAYREDDLDALALLADKDSDVRLEFLSCIMWARAVLARLSPNELTVVAGKCNIDEYFLQLGGDFRDGKLAPGSVFEKRVPMPIVSVLDNPIVQDRFDLPTVQKYKKR